MNHRLRDTICKMSLKGLVAGRQAEKKHVSGKKTPIWDVGKDVDRRVLKERPGHRQARGRFSTISHQGHAS